jgi:HPt (histidine-containing phosphotransfer) domain-containing protein
MKELLDLYVSELPAVIAELGELIETCDGPGLASALHRIKGTTGSYGFPDLSRRAQAIEAQLNLHGDVAQLKAELDDLIQAIQHVERYPLEREANVG